MKYDVIAIGGPTGSGKSSIAFDIARKLDGEIVCCDSMQVYRGLDIGTAKDSIEEQKAVRHWMMDIADPDESFSVGDYCLMAGEILGEIISRGKVPVVVGGTGLYMKNLLDGTSFSEVTESSEEFRMSLETEFDIKGSEIMYGELCNKDPDYAASVKPNDRRRIIRALEIIRSSGKTVSETHIESRNGNGFNAFRIFINFEERSRLYDRINHRVDGMIDSGLIEEARNVYNHRESYKTAAAAIGYKEWFPYFEGTSSFEECSQKLKQATRNYAKRQLTWFRHQPGYVTMYPDVSAKDEIVDSIIKEMTEQ